MDLVQNTQEVPQLSTSSFIIFNSSIHSILFVLLLDGIDADYLNSVGNLYISDLLWVFLNLYDFIISFHERAPRQLGWLLFHICRHLQFMWFDCYWLCQFVLVTFKAHILSLFPFHQNKISLWHFRHFSTNAIDWDGLIVYFVAFPPTWLENLVFFKFFLQKRKWL